MGSRLKVSKWICFMAFIVGAGVMVGCGKHGTPQLDALELANEDLKSLQSFDSSGAEDFDAASNHSFSQVFGGQTGNDVRRYLDERIKHYVRQKDILDISPGEPTYKGWTSLPPAPASMITASNIGTHYWIQGLLDGTQYRLTLAGGEVIPVTSSRNGIMLFGQGYKEEEMTPTGGKVKLPVAYRQAVLIHEARHSDCTGGITQDDLKATRSSLSYAEFFSKSRATRCGHLHSLCRGGLYRGIPACDREPWGSYGVMTVFLEAALRNVERGSEEWQILNAVTIEMKSRLEFDFERMVHSLKDRPDLTSSGLK